jgi:GH35 family endo-1,4-beta-xylanase
MKLILKITYYIFLFFSVSYSIAQNKSKVKGLKDYNHSILVGTTLQSGTEEAKIAIAKKSSLGTTILQEFNLIQTTCYPAWETWKGYKTYDFTTFNNVVNWASKNKIPVSAHVLAGPNLYFPDWFKKGTYTNAELDDLLHDYIKAVITTNNNDKKVGFWNVVNEFILDDGTYINPKAKSFRSKFEQLGMEPDKSGLNGDNKINNTHPIYVRKAFEYARKFTNAKLELRDYNIEFWGEKKAKGFYQMVKHLQNSGTPIDAIGFQAHFKADIVYDWDKMTKSIQEYKKLGLEVYLTEVDMGFKDSTFVWNAKAAEIQKKQYKKMMHVALAGGANWMCFWGVRDNWNKHWLYNKHPLPFDENLNKKPAYFGISDVLQKTSKENNQPKKFKSKTKVSIVNDQFYINGRPSYQGRYWNEHKIEGLLINSRMVNGIFDDLNPTSVNNFAYPDTNEWDADRNTNEFVNAMSEWKKHGLNAFTLNIQGGSPNGYKGSLAINPGYHNDGSLRNLYMQRLDKILKKADELEMVVILGLFYFRQDEYLADENAIKNATNNVIDWLFEKGYKNVLIEICNESNSGGSYNHDILFPNRVHELINLVKNKKNNGHQYLTTTSFSGCTVPPQNVIAVSDYIILHGNGAKNPERLIQLAKNIRKALGNKKIPIVNNEDDHFNFDKPTNNFTTSIKTYVSWGYLDFRFPRETNFEEGYQSIPVDWGINSERKKAFFKLVSEITGVNE